MAKQLPVIDSRTVDKSAADVARLVQANVQVGVKEVDPDGSATFTRLDRSGDTFAFDLEFEGSKKIGFKTFTGFGTVSGTLSLVPLGQTTTRIDLRGSLTIDGAASKAPDFLISKFIKSRLDDLFRDLLTELDGPAAGGGLVA